MRALKVAARVAVLAVVLPLTGCVAGFGGSDVAPNGLTRPEDDLRRELAFGATDAYRAIIEGEHPLPDDDLLRLLYAGIAGRYAGAYRESSRLLDLAGYVAEDRVTISVSREALSMITSDRALPYTPGPTERLMIPYLSALNFLEAGDMDGAAVEARRIEALLDRLDGDAPVEDRPEHSRVLHYFAGLVFDAAGDSNAADVAFRRAGSVAERLGTPASDPAPADSLGEVVLVVERGFVPHRVEQSVSVVLPPAQVEMLADGSVGEKALAATEAAARILTAASHVYGDRSGYYRDRGYRSDVRLDPWRGDQCRDGRWSGSDHRCRVPGSGSGERVDEEPYLLPIAWPVLYQDPPPPAPIRVRAGDRAVDAMAHLDLAAAARADFEDQRGRMIARTVLRAATKLALRSGLEDAVGKKNEAAGEVVGALANLGALLTERADTRCWHLLPGSVSLVRLRLPAGTHELTLETEQGPGGSGALSLGSVEVRPGGVSFVTRRLWR